MPPATRAQPGGFSCAARRARSSAARHSAARITAMRSSRIHAAAPTISVAAIAAVVRLPTAVAETGNSWSAGGVCTLQHCDLSAAILRAHSHSWGRIHLAMHAVMTACVFLTVPISIAKDELDEQEEFTIAVLTTLTAALPLVASLLLITLVVLAPRRKWAALWLGSHRCDAEMWSYRACSGPYEAAFARDERLAQALENIWEDLRLAGAMRPPLDSLRAATLGRGSLIARALARAGLGKDLTKQLGGTRWMARLLTTSSYVPVPALGAACVDAPPHTSAVWANDLVVVDASEPESSAVLAPSAPASARADEPPIAAQSQVLTSAKDFESTREVRPTVEQVLLDGKAACTAPTRSGSRSRDACAAAARQLAASQQLRAQHKASDVSRHACAFAPLTAQQYSELRVWPTIAARVADAPRWQRRLRRLQSGILVCTLASCGLAAASLAEQELSFPSSVGRVARRATRYVPVALAAAAALASIIEAEQLTLRARGADATAQALERAGRWYEALPTDERGGATVRTVLVQQVEQAMRDEVAAFMEMSTGRRAGFATRARAAAAKASSCSKGVGAAAAKLTPARGRRSH